MLQGSRKQIGGLRILVSGRNVKLVKGGRSENKAQYLHLCAIECKCNQRLLWVVFFLFVFFYVCDVKLHCDSVAYLHVSRAVSPGRAQFLF